MMEGIDSCTLAVSSRGLVRICPLPNPNIRRNRANLVCDKSRSSDDPEIPRAHSSKVHFDGVNFHAPSAFFSTLLSTADLCFWLATFPLQFPSLSESVEM